MNRLALQLFVSAVVLTIFGCALLQTAPSESDAAQSQSRRYVITGEVKQPGIYECEVSASVNDLISKAGGLTQWGSGIVIIENGNVSTREYLGGPKRLTSSSVLETPLHRIDHVYIMRME